MLIVYSVLLCINVYLHVLVGLRVLKLHMHVEPNLCTI